jgi:hypothetical protein
MKSMIAFALLASLALPVSAQAPEKQVVTLFKKAQKDSYGCPDPAQTALRAPELAEMQLKGCRDAIAGFKAAAGASDATDGDREYIAPYLFEAKGNLGGILRMLGRVDESDKILAEAVRDVAIHTAGGQHMIALVEGRDVLREAALLNLQKGRVAAASEMIEGARSSADGFYAILAEIKDNKKGMLLLQSSSLDAYKFEMALGSYYADRSRTEDEHKEVDAARKDRELARAALNRAYDWAIRFGDNGWIGFADDYPAVKAGNALVHLSALAANEHDRPKLGEISEKIVVMTCSPPKSVDPVNRKRFDYLCARGHLGVSLADGSLNKVLEERSKAMYDEQMQIMRTNVSRLFPQN